MSYCRAGENSDVYVYPSQSGIVCCNCPMIGQDLVQSDARNMLVHLLGHVALGHKVPQEALARLMEEAGIQPGEMCPCCDSFQVKSQEAVQHFTYGVGPDAVELCATVLVHRCTDCGEEFTSSSGELAREAAVRQHLAAGG